MSDNLPSKWFDPDYWENPAKCYAPGGDKAKWRDSVGRCTWEASTCYGPIKKCEVCGHGYCEYHFPLHIRWRGRKRGSMT